MPSNTRIQPTASRARSQRFHQSRAALAAADAPLVGALLIFSLRVYYECTNKVLPVVWHNERNTIMEAASGRKVNTCQCSRDVPMRLDPSAINTRKFKLFPNPDFYDEETRVPVEDLPFVCLKCDNLVDLPALEVHPVLLGMIQEQVYEWARVFVAVERLGAGPYQMWSDEQFSDISSPFNVLGLEICGESKIQRTCYYTMYRWNERPEQCPKCGQLLLSYYENQAEYDYYLCSECSIAYHRWRLLPD